MIRVRFIAPDGAVTEATANTGDVLLKVAQAAGQPLEGTCDGDMACATCHVVVDPIDFARLPAASAEEEDMLDLAQAATRTSRLACQIVMTPTLGNLTLRLPGGSGNGNPQ